MPRKKSPPVNLDKYLEGRGKTYISYAIGAKMYSMPYWTFVSVAKEAGATWALRKTAIVDMDKLDAYLDKVAKKWLKEKGNELMHRMYLIDEK